MSEASQVDMVDVADARNQPIADLIPRLNHDNIYDTLFKADINGLTVSDRDPETGQWENPEGPFMT